jgi:hypothetical protein
MAVSDLIMANTRYSPSECLCVAHQEALAAHFQFFARGGDPKHEQMCALVFHTYCNQQTAQLKSFTGIMGVDNHLGEIILAREGTKTPYVRVYYLKVRFLTIILIP